MLKMRSPWIVARLETTTVEESARLRVRLRTQERSLVQSIPVTGAEEPQDEGGARLRGAAIGMETGGIKVIGGSKSMGGKETGGRSIVTGGKEIGMSMVMGGKEMGMSTDTGGSEIGMSMAMGGIGKEMGMSTVTGGMGRSMVMGGIGKEMGGFTITGTTLATWQTTASMVQF